MEFDFSRNTSFCITENGADSLHARRLVVVGGPLSNDNGDGNENVISKYKFALIRDLKQGRRRRLGERNKFAYSVGKNNSFARPARAFHILIHFFAVLVLTTT